MREEYTKGISFHKPLKMTKEVTSPQGARVTAEFNAASPEAGEEDRAIFLRVAGASISGLITRSYATLTPDQAEELGSHLVKLANEFRETHKPLTRVQVIDALPVGTVFKTSLATYVRTETGVTILAGFYEGEKRGIDPYFRNTPGDLMMILFNPEVTK